MKIFDKVNMSDSIYDNSDSNKIKGRIVITDTRTGKTYESHNTVVNNGKKLLMNALMGYSSGNTRICYVGFGQSASTGNYGNTVSNNANSLNENIIKSVSGSVSEGEVDVISYNNTSYVNYGSITLGKFIPQNSITFKTADNEDAYPYLQIDFSISGSEIQSGKTLSEIALFLLDENAGDYDFPMADKSAAQFSANGNGEIMFSKVDIGKSLPLSDSVTYNIKYYIYF